MVMLWGAVMSEAEFIGDYRACPAGCSLMVYVVMTVVGGMRSCIASLYMHSLVCCSLMYSLSLNLCLALAHCFMLMSWHVFRRLRDIWR